MTFFTNNNTKSIYEVISVSVHIALFVLYTNQIRSNVHQFFLLSVQTNILGFGFLVLARKSASFKTIVSIFPIFFIGLQAVYQQLSPSYHGIDCFFSPEIFTMKTIFHSVKCVTVKICCDFLFIYKQNNPGLS